VLAKIGSQKFIAKHLRIQQSTVAKWVRIGFIPPARLPDLQKLCDDMGLGIKLPKFEDKEENRRCSSCQFMHPNEGGSFIINKRAHVRRWLCASCTKFRQQSINKVNA
jgi:hypothetical protein